MTTLLSFKGNIFALKARYSLALRITKKGKWRCCRSCRSGLLNYQFPITGQEFFNMIWQEDRELLHLANDLGFLKHFIWYIYLALIINQLDLGHCTLYRSLYNPNQTNKSKREMSIQFVANYSWTTNSSEIVMLDFPILHFLVFGLSCMIYRWLWFSCLLPP